MSILINLLIDKIIVERIDDYNINLNIIIDSKFIVFTDKYDFNYSYRRGYNTKYTNKYSINYLVSISN